MPITSDPFQGGAPEVKNTQPRRQRSLLLPILFTTAVGVLVSAALFLLAGNLERAWQRAEVTQRAAVVATALQRQLEEPLSLLRSIASVYSSSRRTGREGFHALALEALPR